MDLALTLVYIVKEQSARRRWDSTQWVDVVCVVPAGFGTMQVHSATWRIPAFLQEANAIGWPDHACRDLSPTGMQMTPSLTSPATRRAHTHTHQARYSKLQRTASDTKMLRNTHTFYTPISIYKTYSIAFSQMISVFFALLNCFLYKNDSFANYELLIKITVWRKALNFSAGIEQIEQKWSKRSEIYKRNTY